MNHASKLKSFSLTPALFLALLPMLGGCYFQARGVVRPPRVAVTAELPAPPSASVVVNAPAPPSGSIEIDATAPTVSAGAAAEFDATTVDASSSDDGIMLGEGENIYVTVTTPPPPRPANVVVTAPPPRRGFVWVRGHWSWSNGWTWQRARFIRVRPGRVFIAPRYDSTRRVWIRAHWEARQVRDDQIRPRPQPHDLMPIPAPRARVSINLPAPPPPPRVNASVNVSVNASARAGR